MAFDFWRGGIHILAPEEAITQVLISSRTSTPQDSNLDPTLEPKRSKFTWISGWANSYLFKHQREDNLEYDERCTRAINLPVFQYIINVNASGILRNPPRRIVDINPFWPQYLQNCDLRGTTYDALMRQCLCLLFVFGRIHVLTDRPKYNSPALSRGEELYRGERPYCSIVTPLDLVDWECDARGNFLWIVIREIQLEPREPGQNQEQQIYQYRVFTQNEWQLWQKAKRTQYSQGKFVLVDGGEHSLGRVPLDTMYAPLFETPSLAVESPLADILDLNRDIINKLSELDELERMQSFALLCVQETDTGVGELDISPFRCITTEAGTQMPQYIAPPTDLANGKWSRIIAKLFTIRQLASSSRGKAEYSKEERSGDALAIESEDKHNSMCAYATALEEFDWKVRKTASDWMGMIEPTRAVYSKQFDVRSINTQIQEIAQLFNLGVKGDELKLEITKPLLIKKLIEAGLETKEIDGLMSSVTFEEKKEENQFNLFKKENTEEKMENGA